MRRAVRILGASRVLNYSKPEGINFHTYAMDVARDTGRRVLGQLWLPDPIFEEVIHAEYALPIANMLNSTNTLLHFLQGNSRG